MMDIRFCFITKAKCLTNVMSSKSKKSSQPKTIAKKAIRPKTSKTQKAKKAPDRSKSSLKSSPISLPKRTPSPKKRLSPTTPPKNSPKKVNRQKRQSSALKNLSKKCNTSFSSLDDILPYMFEKERVIPVNWNRLTRKHPSITLKNRKVLVGWMCEVLNEYRQSTEMLHTAVTILDQYLSKTGVVIPTSQIQLAGIAAMYIATEYAEKPVSVNDYVYISDNAYDSSLIEEYKTAMLATLDNNICYPTCADFLILYRPLSLIYEDNIIEVASNYIAELSLLHPESRKNYPSFIAAAVLYFVYSSFQKYWNADFTDYETASLKEYYPVIRKWVELEYNTRSEISVKYSYRDYHGISTRFNEIMALIDHRDFLIQQIGRLEGSLAKGGPAVKVLTDRVKEINKRLEELSKERVKFYTIDKDAE